MTCDLFGVHLRSYSSVASTCYICLASSIVGHGGEGLGGAVITLEPWFSKSIHFMYSSLHKSDQDIKMNILSHVRFLRSTYGNCYVHCTNLSRFVFRSRCLLVVLVENNVPTCDSSKWGHKQQKKVTRCHKRYTNPSKTYSSFRLCQKKDGASERSLALWVRNKKRNTYCTARTGCNATRRHWRSWTPSR